MVIILVGRISTSGKYGKGHWCRWHTKAIGRQEMYSLSYVPLAPMYRVCYWPMHLVDRQWIVGLAEKQSVRLLVQQPRVVPEVISLDFNGRDIGIQGSPRRWIPMSGRWIPAVTLATGIHARGRLQCTSLKATRGRVGIAVVGRSTHAANLLKCFDLCY